MLPITLINLVITGAVALYLRDAALAASTLVGAGT
jgi:hypothetical protein